MRGTILRLKIGQMQSRLTRDAVRKRKSTAAMIAVVVMDDTAPQILCKAFHLALRSAGDSRRQTVHSPAGVRSRCAPLLWHCDCYLAQTHPFPTLPVLALGL